MTGLPELAGLYDVEPIRARLVGGVADGREFLIPDDRELWLVPEPVDAAAWLAAGPYAAGPQTTLTDRLLIYRRAGVTDDGTRLYHYSP
jgi:hypothetical protein